MNSRQHYPLSNGFATILSLLAMLLIAVSLPIATKLVQQNQDNRSNAAIDSTYGPSCSSHANASDCSKAGCYWETQMRVCSGAIPTSKPITPTLTPTKTSCSSHANASDCSKAGCYWETQMRVCSGAIPTSKPITPTLTPTKSKTCTSSNCGGCGSPNECRLSGCYWETQMRVCSGAIPTPKPSCSSHANASDCSKAGCYWETQMRVCSGAIPTSKPITPTPTVSNHTPVCGSGEGACIVGIPDQVNRNSTTGESKWNCVIAGYYTESGKFVNPRTTVSCSYIASNTNCGSLDTPNNCRLAGCYWETLVKTCTNNIPLSLCDGASIGTKKCIDQLTSAICTKTGWDTNSCNVLTQRCFNNTCENKKDYYEDHTPCAKSTYHLQTYYSSDACPKGYSCNRFTETCEAVDASAGKKGWGASCTTDADCLEGYCAPKQNQKNEIFPQMYCQQISQEESIDELYMKGTEAVGNILAITAGVVGAIEVGSGILSAFTAARTTAAEKEIGSVVSIADDVSLEHSLGFADDQLDVLTSGSKTPSFIGPENVKIISNPDGTYTLKNTTGGNYPIRVDISDPRVVEYIENAKKSIEGSSPQNNTFRTLIDNYFASSKPGSLHPGVNYEGINNMYEQARLVGKDSINLGDFIENGTGQCFESSICKSVVLSDLKISNYIAIFANEGVGSGHASTIAAETIEDALQRAGIILGTFQNLGFLTGINPSDIQIIQLMN